MIRLQEKLKLKDWIFQKVAREQGLRVMADGVFGIFAETEKAYKVILDVVNKPVMVWVPKSALESSSCEEDKGTLKGSFEEVFEQYEIMKSLYV